MANYPKELIDLTQEYLTDGVITPKERQVLLNKAVMLNVDPNEFDLYIDAQLQKMEQIAHEAAQKQKGRLCPYCQEPLPMFDDRCPGCGKNITPEASKEVEELIDVLETALVSFKAVAEKKKNSAKMSYPATPAMQFKTFSNMFTGKEDRENEKTDISYATTKAEVERYIRKAKMYYGSNKTVNFLVSEVELAVAEAEKSVASAKAKKRNIIIAIVVGVILLYVVIFSFAFAFTEDTEDTGDSFASFDTYNAYDSFDVYDEYDSDDEYDSYDDFDSDDDFYSDEEFDSEDDFDSDDDFYSDEEYDSDDAEDMFDM